MKTLAKLKYEVLEIAAGGKVPDDLSLDDRLVVEWINTQRALWIRNELNKKRTASANIIQDLGCVDLTSVDRAECCDINIGCTILRTESKIPKPIELAFVDSITRVGPIDKLAKAYTFIPYQFAATAGSGRFNTRAKFAYLKEGYIYIKVPNGGLMGNVLDKVNIQGIFEDPTAVAAFTDCDGTSCYSEDDDYPINAWMWQFIKDQIVKTDLKYMQFVRTDKSNDANDEVVTQVKK